MGKSSWFVRGTPNLRKKLDETRIERVKNGLDEEMKSYSELLEASTRFAPLWDILKKADIKKSEGNGSSRRRKKFIKDTDAQFVTFNIYTFIITAFLVAVFFAGLIYVMGLVTGVFHTVGIVNEVNAGHPGYVNMTLAADQTFGVVNNSIQALRMVALVYILGLGITIIITNALLKIHPLFFFAYLLIVILGVIFSAPIANAYLTLLNSNIFAGTLGTFTAVNYIILNLPVFTLAIGAIGAIFLFINLIRSGEGGSLR